MKRVTPNATPVKREAIPAPDKPWEGFPLYWHPRGYWMCKRGGRDLRYEADAQRSYERFLVDENERLNRNAPVRRVKRYVLRDAVNLCLTRQQRNMEDGKIGPVQFAKWRKELERELPKAVSLNTDLAEFNARTPDDAGPGELFARIRARAIKRGFSAAHRHVTLVRKMFDLAAKKHLMRAPDYADEFDPPSSSQIDKRRHELDAEHGARAWTVDELKVILDKARRLGEKRQTAKGVRPGRSPHIYPQILLGLFAGFGSDDCSAVPDTALDTDTGIIKFPRVKNGRPRVAWLPPRVVQAIQWSREHRAPASTDDARGLMFRTATGRRCNAAPHRSDDKGLVSVGRNDAIGQRFKRLVGSLELHRHRAGFKTLRAMCRTLLVGSGVDNDIVAVIMGRSLRHRVDEYYLRGELRNELVKAGRHLESLLLTQTPPRQTGSPAGPDGGGSPRKGRAKGSRRGSRA